MLTVLDVLIGVFVVYLVLSLMVSAATEWVAGVFKLRASTLQQAISRLLEAPGEIAKPRLSAAEPVTPAAPKKPGEATHAFYAHPLVTALSSRKHPPSYVPAPLFAEVAEDLVAKGRVPDTAPIRAAVGRERLQALFGDAMERTSGWYKRLAQSITLAIAAVVTVAANADTLQLTHVLWTSRAAREAAVAAAERVAAQPPPAAIDAGYPRPENPISDDRADADEPRRSAEVETADTPPGEQNEQLLSQLIGWGSEYRRLNARHCAALQASRNATCGDPKRREECRRLLGEIAADPRCTLSGPRLEASAAFPGGNFLDPTVVVPLAVPHLLGWILTVAAISFGAPFWFDTLKRFLNIRSAGRSPEEGRQGGAR
jgi:hypothetical protein